MKPTLEAAVAAITLSVSGCAVSNSSLSIRNASTVAASDGKYDSLDNYVNPEDLPKLADFNYMVISESKYKISNEKNEPNEKIVTLHSIGSSIIYKDINDKTYLATANHVVENDKVMYDFFGRKYELLSEEFFLLEDEEVDRLHSLLRSKNFAAKKEVFYVRDAEGNERESLSYFIRPQPSSDAIEISLQVIKPKKIKAVAQNKDKDLAIISVPKLKYQPQVYKIGNAQELQIQNIVYVVGWPGGLLENTTRGHVTRLKDSGLITPDPETNFIFDAPISPGNSGGGIFAVRDGELELVGLAVAGYRGMESVFVGAKINYISDFFKGNSILCAGGWKCNLSAPYELKL